MVPGVAGALAARAASLSVARGAIRRQRAQPPCDQAKIRLPESELARPAARRSSPGISETPAEAFVVAGQRTALTYLLKPFLDALTRAAKAE